jgi:hypothetical protein
MGACPPLSSYSSNDPWGFAGEGNGEMCGTIWVYIYIYIYI